MPAPPRPKGSGAGPHIVLELPRIPTTNADGASPSRRSVRFPPTVEIPPPMKWIPLLKTPFAEADPVPVRKMFPAPVALSVLALRLESLAYRLEIIAIYRQ